MGFLPREGLNVEAADSIRLFPVAPGPALLTEPCTPTGLSALLPGARLQPSPGLPDRTHWGTRPRGSPESTWRDSHTRSRCGLDAVRCHPGEAGTRGCGHCPARPAEPADPALQVSHAAGSPGRVPTALLILGWTDAPSHRQLPLEGGMGSVLGRTSRAAKAPPAGRRAGLSKFPASA